MRFLPDNPPARRGSFSTILEGSRQEGILLNDPESIVDGLTVNILQFHDITL